MSEAKFAKYFDLILERMAAAEPPHKILKELRVSTNFIAWCYMDERRKALYQEAQSVATESLASQILELTQNPPDPEEIYFIQNKLKALQYLMKCWNRQRYGDVTQLEVTNTVDITQAMDAAQNRLNALRQPLFIGNEGNEDG